MHDIDDLISAYLADTPADRSVRRRRETARLVRRLHGHAGIPILSVTTAGIEAWLDTLGLKGSTRPSYGRAIYDFLHWAQTKGLIDDNPALPLRRVMANWEPPTGLRRPEPGYVPTLKETVDLYVWDRYGRREITKKSARHFSDRLRMLVDALGPDMPINQLDRNAILAWQHSVGSHSQASRRAYLSTIRTFCAWVMAEGYIHADPTAAIQKVREPRRVPRALPEESVVKLLAACEDPRDRAIIWLQVGIGLRCAEVAALEMADYDPQGRKVFVRGKGGHERVLPLPPPVVDALEDYLTVGGRYAGPLIRPKIGTSFGRDKHLDPQVIVCRVGALIKKAGIKNYRGDGVSAHALRHTCASDVLDRCHDVRVVQEILGHQSLSTTQVYLRRASQEKMRDALEGRTYGQPAGGHA